MFGLHTLDLELSKELDMARGSITDEDIDFTETWENIATSQNAIIKLNARGDEVQEVIAGRRNFMLTTQERKITEDRVRDVANNPFRNGAFRPVIVPSSVTVESNPNALSDDEILKILGASELAFQEWMSSIDSLPTMRRLIELAEESEDLTVKRLRQIEDRFLELRGDRRQLEVKDDQLKRFLSDKPGGSSGPNIEDERAARRAAGSTGGGRSADYRQR